ncbi:uncharacterized protein KRP23_15138 [Phytophthora ramorum]|uniref:uncharacterized protein n=1 Tax=Phytophthora ramorum TaxID=164328 RepID=UPI0030AD92D0|nr:hypothetical protein KRP23_15138 [Phytophthora ramorum]
MSGFTPRTGDEPMGLQDVLAFIADFELEESGAGVNHEDDEWMDDDASPTGQAPVSGKDSDANLEELFAGRRRPTPTVTTPNSIASSQASNALGLASPSPSAGSHSDTAGASKPARRHRVSRKEELDYLRTKVTEMEDQLKQLKVNSEGVQSPAPPAPVTPESEQAAMKLEQSIALWKKMAKRQKGQREMVESENSKLREKLKTQVRMAKSLQRILRKRERAAEQITGEAPKRLKQLSQDAHAIGSTGEFDSLTESLDALYSFTDDRMALCPTVSGSQPLLREQDVKYNDLTGMFIEFMQSKLVPFDLDAVNRANWRHTSEPGIKFNSYFEESAETTQNMVLRKFGVEIKQDERIAKMAGKQAIRRYVEGDRIVIVRNSVIDRVELSGAATGSLAFRDSGWIVMKDVTGLVSASGPMTLVQSYSALTPDVDLDAQWEVGALTDFVLQSREDIEVGNESIVENLLLEEVFQRATS